MPCLVYVTKNKRWSPAVQLRGVNCSVRAPRTRARPRASRAATQDFDIRNPSGEI